MNEFVQVLVSFDSKDEAQKVARALIEERLAGCVQVVGPVESVYHWKGEVESAEEYLLQIKTGRTLYEKVEKRVLELHPYETAEVIALPIVAGSIAYLNWLRAETEREK